MNTNPKNQSELEGVEELLNWLEDGGHPNEPYLDYDDDENESDQWNNG